MAQGDWGWTPEVVLLVVMIVQVPVLVFQFWAVRQQTRISILEKRVELYEAAKDCVRELASFTEYRARSIAQRPNRFDEVYHNFTRLLRSYRYLFDEPTQGLMDEVAAGCWALRLEAYDGDLEYPEEHEALGDEKRLALERSLAGPKLDELAERVGSHLKVSRLLG